MEIVFWVLAGIAVFVVAVYQLHPACRRLWPIVVAVGTYGTRLTRNEKLYMGWMCPRGIVAASTASTFALGLQQAGFPHSERLVAITFLTIVGTVMAYGLSALPLARRLNLLADQQPPLPQPVQLLSED